MPRIRLLAKAPKHRSHTNKRFIDSNKWRKFYGSKVWRDLREAKLMEQPLCEICLANDTITPATEVHHIDKFGDYAPDEQLMWEKFLAWDNLMSICHRCHKYIHNHA